MSKDDKRNHVLVVDDERDIRELLEITLMRMGLEVDAVGTVADALQRLESREYDLVLTDMRLPDGEGLTVVEEIARRNLDIPVAVITAYGSTENAVHVMKAGAFDYLAKPLALEQLRTLVKSALALGPVHATQNRIVEDARMLGQSVAMRHVREMIDKLARSNAPVYITGESGSGKERAARLIHEQSARADKPFVPVNCGAIPESLMESEFFGYKKGAFTGADQERDGFFQAANTGTIFLDEVADLPLLMQVKLLRVIQEKRVRKLGGPIEEAVDVRVICATHKNLADCVTAGTFRQDLYYRLNVIELRMPALREMRDDVDLIAQAILARLSAASGQPVPQFEPEALKALAHYDYPGNVRELENILERALALSDGKKIGVNDLQLSPRGEEGGDVPLGASADKYPLQDYLDRLEKTAILEALDRTRFNRTAAAKLLGITFRSLRYRLERLGIE